MKVSSIAASILASTWPPQVAARESSTRALQATIAECLEAQTKAAELIESAEVGCGTAASNPSWADGSVMPNPTCLLLLCTAQRAGNELLQANCDEPQTLLPDATRWGTRGLCELVPGFLPPLGPTATDDHMDITFDFKLDGGNIDIDILSNDDITYGNDFTVSVTSQPQNGLCAITDSNHLVFTPNTDIDSSPPDQKCTYEVCYTDRYADYCDEAVVTIEVLNAPTNSPTGSPTVGCYLDLAVEAQAFPPADFDPTEQCIRDGGSKPSSLTLKFNSGNCDQSDNEQDDNFECEDEGDGPTLEGAKYVVIKDYDDDKSDEVGEYFAGSVEVGKLIKLDGCVGDVELNPGLNIAESHTKGSCDQSKLPSNLYIKVYSDMTKENLLQTVEFHSSCSKTLRLQDKFGGFQVAAYENPLQGEVSIFQDLTLDWTIMNVGLINVTLTDASIEFSKPDSISVDGLIGEEIEHGQSLFYNQTSFPIDTTVGSAEYSAMVVGSSDGGICDAKFTGMVEW